jgi:hypothetical protein
MNLTYRLSIALLALIIAPAGFAEKPHFGDTLTIGLGGMSHRGNAVVAVTRPDVPRDKLTFSDLGLDDETSVFWGDFAWQFAERWKFRLNYSSFDASGENLATAGGNYEDIEWGIGARLTSDFEMNLYIADLTWDFLKTDNGHLGVGVGLHAADISLDLLVEVGAEINGEAEFITLGQESNSVLAPLPNLSLAGGYQFGEKFYVNASIGYLSLNIDKYDGELFSARAAAEWRPLPHAGLGLAYQYVDVNLEVDGSSKQEFYDFEFYGPVLFVSFGF